MATKKKKNNDLVLVGTMIPKPLANALRTVAEAEDRSVSKIVKKLIEDSPDIQRVLKQAQAA
jgi:hypothetical protein